jgi:hypothetical protein
MSQPLPPTGVNRENPIPVSIDVIKTKAHKVKVKDGYRYGQYNTFLRVTNLLDCTVNYFDKVKFSLH